MKARGFTLVELMVAILILAIMATMAYGAIQNSVANRDIIQANEKRLLEVQTAMRVMTQDFVQLVPRPVRQPVGDGWLPALQGEASGTPLVSFTRGGWANPAGIQRPGLQRVAYVLENGTLRREHWPVLDATLASVTLKRELVTKVRSFRIRYMDVGRQWRESWPVQGVASPGALPGEDLSRPIAVEVTLELEDWGTIMRVIEVAA
jgi:general secretion pathway protein J